jgi:hypothetical protein
MPGFVPGTHLFVGSYRDMERRQERGDDEKEPYKERYTKERYIAVLKNRGNR